MSNLNKSKSHNKSTTSVAVVFPWFVKGYWTFIIFFIIGFTIFGKSLSYDYSYLDDNQIVLNQMDNLKKTSAIPQAFVEDAFHTTGKQAFYYRPLLTVSFALDAMIGGGELSFFHFTNIVMHIVATWLLFLLLVGLGHARVKSFLFSLLFLVHPVVTQAVAWIPGRNDTLLAIFIFSTVIYFIKFLKTSSYFHLFLQLIFYIFALLSKETAIALPVIACIYLALTREKNGRNVFILISSWIVITVIWLLIRYNVLGGTNGYTVADSIVSILHNMPALFSFIGKAIIPVGLSVFPILKDMTVSIIAGVFALIVLTLLIVRTKEKCWVNILFGIAWFLLFLLPSFIKSKSQAADFTEHRVYVSLVGIILILLETDLIKLPDWKKNTFRIPIMSLIALFSVVTLFHLNNFQNRITFWQNAVETSPTHAFNYNNLGAMFYMNKNLADAEKYFRKAVEINPNEPLANGNIGLVCMNTERYQEAEKYYLKEIEINPAYDLVYVNMGLLYANNGMFEQAVHYWEKALTINPFSSQVYNNLIFIYTKLNQTANVDRIRQEAALHEIVIN